MLEQKTFTFPFEDKDWGNKFLMGSLFYLISPFLLFVPLIIVRGYVLRVWRDAIAGLPPRLPEWEDWEEMGIQGVVYYALTFLYSLPLWVAWAVVMVVAVGGALGLAWVVEGVEGGGASDIVPVVGALLLTAGILLAVVLALAVSLFIGLLTSVAIGRYLETGRFGAAFEFGAVWRAMRANLGGLVVAWVALLVMGLLWGTFVGFLNAIPCCGSLLVYVCMAPIMFYMSLVQARLMGQVYHEAQRRLTGAPAVSVEKLPAERGPVALEPVEKLAEEPAVQPAAEPAEDVSVDDSASIETLGLSARVQRVLHDAGLTTVGQVLERLAEGEEALLSIRGLGAKSLDEIKAQLTAHGFLD